MPKRKKGSKPLHPHQESAAEKEKLPDPLTMLKDPQPPETLTPSPHQQQEEDPVVPQPPPGGGGEERQEQEEPQAMVASPPSPPRAPPALDVAALPDVPAPANPPPTSRKAQGKRKKPFSGKKLAAMEEKLDLLRQNFRPIPFAPGRAPDLPRHERLFRALGLWDFALLDLDRDLRPDLLAPLIANYDHHGRRSLVRNARLSVSRADLARALALPVKRDKAAPPDSDLELFSGEEAAAVISDFISNWMLLLEDACELPSEVVTVTRQVKEGQPYKVDWAGLMWTMVEKELLEAPRSGQCYYASHLQRLIKHQRPELFEAGAEPEIEPEPEPSIEVAPAEEEDDTGGGGDGDDGCAMRTGSLEDFQDTNPDNHGPGLSLGLGGEVDAMVGLGECKGGEEEHWLAGGKDAGVDHCLRRCNLSNAMGMECDDMDKEGDGRGGSAEERFDDELAAKFSSLEGLTSTDLLQAMETGNVSYSMPVHPLDPSSGEFLAMGTETHKCMTLDPGPASPFLFGNNCKREIDEIDDDDTAVHPLSQGNQQKRMRSEGPWDHTPSAFDACLEQIQCWMGKAKMVFVEKEQSCTNSELELQYMNNMLQQKDQIIQSLEKASMEQLQKSQLETCRFEHELRVMARIVHGYKKALKETRNAFAEYRKQFPQGDEPLYKDVDGTGGIVLSTTELERQRLEKEKEMRDVAAEVVNDFQREWFGKLSKHIEWLTKSLRKVGELGEEIKLLKERIAKSKVSETLMET